MVFRKGKKGITNTGNTIRYTNISVTWSERAILKKQLLNSNFTSDERDKAAKDCGKYFDDGELQAKHNINSGFYYSLNKRKRWMLVDMLKSVVEDEDVAEEGYRVVLYERVPPSSYKRTWPDCIGYHDSKLTPQKNHQTTNCSSSKHKYPNEKYSFLTDLRLSGHSKTCHKKDDRKKEFHNQHFRGVQRNQRSSQTEDRDYTPRLRVIHGDPEDDDHDVPEIRYEVSYPRKPVAGVTDYYYKSHDDDYRDSKHAKSKVKGRQSKPWADEYYRGGCTKYINECINERHDGLSHGTEDESDDEKYTSTYDSNKKCSVSLSDLLDLKYSKKRKSKIVEKAKSRHPNKAMATHSQYYGKDMIIYSDSMDNSNLLNEEYRYNTCTERNKEDINTDDVLNKSDKVLAENTEVELDQTYITCQISLDSIKVYLQNGNSNRIIQTSMCKPARYVVSLSGEATLLIWEKISLCTDSSYSDFWIRIQDNFSKSTDMNSILKDVLKSNLPCLLSLQELILLAERIVQTYQFSLQQNSVNAKSHWSKMTNLANDLDLVLRLSGSQIAVKSVQDAHIELVDEIKDKPEDCSTFEVISVEECYSDVTIVPDYCDICVMPFADVILEMTSLLSCQHSFCNQCWMNYISERIRQGDECIPCLGYQCEETLDDIMIMSLTLFTTFDRWIKRRQENLIEKSGKWKWCPNNSCKNVAKITNDMNNNTGGTPVRCKCKTNWCFDCQQTDHWPATCDQSQIYKKMLEQNGDESGRSVVPSKTYFVHVKKCPKCNYPMEKNGGCSHMTCRCKHHFCWECLGDWYSHANNFLQCTGGLRHEVTIELDNAVLYPLPLKFYKRSVQHRFNWIALNGEKIRKKVIHYEALQMAKLRKTERKRINLDSANYIEASKQNLMQYFICIKQTHQILENIMIVMSNLTRKLRDRYLEKILMQIEFCISRQEQLLEQKNLSKDTLIRVDTLHKSSWKCLKTLTHLIPAIQTKIAKSKQKILGKPVSKFESYI